MGWPPSDTLFISSKLSSKMNTASNWIIIVFQHTQGKLGRESWIMMKACTIMTFLMTITDGCAPETLCRTVDIFSNVPVTHYVHNLAVNRGQITPVAMGTSHCPKTWFFHVESPSVACTVVSFLKLYSWAQSFMSQALFFIRINIKIIKIDLRREGRWWRSEWKGAE